MEQIKCINAHIESGRNLVIVLVGPSGCGKSTFVNKLVKEVPKGKTNVVLSVDDFRQQLNNGVYPTDSAEHVKINKVAIPAYQRAVHKAKENLIILDNTHLKWTPDVSFAVGKCIDYKYDILLLVPEINEYTLFTNRGTHGVDESTFLKMLARWSGNRMGHMMSRIIQHEVLDNFGPSKPDSFSVNKMFYLKWKDSFVYVLDGYLGYVDKRMVLWTLKAGNYMNRIGKGDLFLKKDGITHITLIKPKDFKLDELKKIAQELVKSGDPPHIEYTGISEINNKKNGLENKVVFLSINKKSQNAWKERLASLNSKPKMNPDGLHVTLGFTHSDVWDVDKSFQPPTWEISGIQYGLLGTTFVPTLSETISVDNVGQLLQHSQKFINFVNDSIPDISKVDVSESIMNKIGFLVSNSNIKPKLRKCPDEIFNDKTIYLLTIQVFNGYKPDDDIYKMYPSLQKGVPRGLCYAFSMGHEDRILRYSNVTFPTPKFFGDNDTDQDVEVVNEKDLMNSAPKDSSFIITKKANGEMFTLNTSEIIEDNDNSTRCTRYMIVMGSKNNKFAFSYHKDMTIDDIQSQLMAYLETESKGKSAALIDANLRSSEWTNQNLWVEMSLYMFEKLMSLNENSRMQFLDWIHAENLTCCGEFESWLHPHLESFSDGYQRVRFFALTTHDENMNCIPPDANVTLDRLRKIRDWGLDTIEFYKSNCKDLVEIRKNIMEKENKEGIVVLVVWNGDNKIHSMVKMKTVWYVVNRGIREKLKRVLQLEKVKGKGGNNSKTETFEQRYDELHRLLKRTVPQKLDIFGLKHDSIIGKKYLRYIEQLRKYIVEEYKKDRTSLIHMFKYDYPKLIRNVNETI